jgi:hypothetical protein
MDENVHNMFIECSRSKLDFQFTCKYQDLKLRPWSYVESIFKQYYWLTHILWKLINDQCIIRNHTTTKNEKLTIICCEEINERIIWYFLCGLSNFVVFNKQNNCYYIINRWFLFKRNLISMWYISWVDFLKIQLTHMWLMAFSF